MTKLLFSVRGAFFAFLLSVFAISCGNDDPLTITNSPEANIQEVPLNEELATTFPQSLIFIGKMSETSYITVLNSLPTTQAVYDSVFAKMMHANMTLLEYDNKVFGLIPKHAFRADFELLEILSGLGFKAKQKNDLVTIILDKNQKCLTAKPLEEVDSLLQGVDGTVQTLNCFIDDQFIHQYTISGKVFYIPADQMKQMTKGAKQTNGQLSESEFSRGAYVVKIPESLWEKIPGMSGGSLTANINGKEKFLGLQTNRMIMGGIEPNGDTTKFFLLGFQPVLEEDFVETEEQ